MIQICDKEKCFGCGLCTFACEYGAIQLKMKDGSWRPIINDGCRECNKCSNYCIANKFISSKKLTTDSNVEVYGIATILSRHFVQNRGSTVVGAWFNPQNQSVEHRICKNNTEIEFLKGSKYVKSNIEPVMRQLYLEKDLKDVLIIGVPCEVYAFKIFFKIFRPSCNVFTIDLLCHGGSSPQCFKEHLENICKKFEAQEIGFRGGKYNCQFIVKSDNQIKYKNPQFVDPYFSTFMRHTIFQKVCYECPFAGTERIGDITLGDFWGLEESLFNDLGTSLIMVNTLKGSKMMEMIKSGIEIFKRDLTEAMNGNDTLKNPTENEDEYSRLWELINVYGFARAFTDIYEDYFSIVEAGIQN